MAAKKGDPDSGSGGESSERGSVVGGVAVAGVLLVVVLAMLMGCTVLLLRIGVPLWPAVAVLVVLCGMAVVVVRRVMATTTGQGGDGWAGRLLKAVLTLVVGAGQ